MLDKGTFDVHGGSGAVVENELSFLVLTLLHLGIGLTVLQYLGLAVDIQMEAYLFVC